MLDTIARVPLWEHGLDYGHGTGHGVGYFLNVHEGPQSFSRVIPDATMAMQPGMITSVEPGLYRPGQWGVRVENLVLSVPAAGPAERVRRVPRVRDAHALPDRCPLPRAVAAARRRDRLAGCVPRHGSRAAGAARQRRRARLADAAHRAPGLGFVAAGARRGGLRRVLRTAFVALRRISSAPVPDSSQAGFAAPRRSLEFAPSHPATVFQGARHDQPPHPLRRPVFRRRHRQPGLRRRSAQQTQAVETPRPPLRAPATVVMPLVEVTGRRAR